MTTVGEVTVGVDIGTTSVKAVLADSEGRVLARARVAHGLNSPVAGAFEHVVDSAWRDGVVEALRRVTAHIDTEPEHRVAAVNVSAMVPSLAAVDEGGRALSPGLLYGDHRGVTHVNDPHRAGDPGELLAFLAWLSRHAPTAAGYWPAQAVANHTLCGIGAIDSITAMTAHPLFDYSGWDRRLTDEVGVSTDSLPVIVPGATPAGRVMPGLPAAGALVGGGTIDAFGEQIVAGADSAGDVLVICGATLITWAVLDSSTMVAGAMDDTGAWTIPHTASGMSMIGGPSNAGGIFVDRAHCWLGVDPTSELGSIPADDLPIWLPYIRGERSPLHRRDLRGSLHDLALHHDSDHLRRAAYEASAFVVRHHLDLAGRAGSSGRRIVATGGGTRSTAWMRALADVTGLPVDVVEVPEGAALGSAFIARCTAGLEKNPVEARRWARVNRRVEPRADWVEATDTRYRRFRRLTDG